MVEFKDEEFVKKAIETMNKHDLSGRPLNIKEVGTIRFCIVMLGPGFNLLHFLVSKVSLTLLSLF